MPSPSAGLLLYRRRGEDVEVLLVRRGALRDSGRRAAWVIPSAELRPGEEPPAAARRALGHVAGAPAPSGSFLALGAVKQHQHRTIRVWACEVPVDESLCESAAEQAGPAERSAVVAAHRFLSLAEARLAIVPSQRRFLDELDYRLAGGGAEGAGGVTPSS